MVIEVSKGSLSPARARLVELMQGINFGRISGLVIRNCNPILDPAPLVEREVKFGSENGPRPEAAKEDFILKAQVLDLFAEFDAIGDGVVLSLEVKHGLPFKMTVEEKAA